MKREVWSDEERRMTVCREKGSEQIRRVDNPNLVFLPLLLMVLGIGNWVLSAGYWILGSGYWVPGTGYWVLGTGYLVLGTGYWILGSVYMSQLSK